MVGQVLLRFLIGGAVVSAFAAIGEVFTPKSLSGLFGAAPSVALATLGIAYATTDAATVAVASRWMLVATFALFVYASCCIALGRRRGLPMWLAATASWGVWIVVAGASLWWLSGAFGV